MDSAKQFIHRPKIDPITNYFLQVDLESALYWAGIAHFGRQRVNMGTNPWEEQEALSLCPKCNKLNCDCEIGDSPEEDNSI